MPVEPYSHLTPRHHQSTVRMHKDAVLVLTPHPGLPCESRDPARHRNPNSNGHLSGLLSTTGDCQLSLFGTRLSAGRPASLGDESVTSTL